MNTKISNGVNLILVESPTKSRTLKSFLGKEYEIAASIGHIRDLPKAELGVDVEHNFKPKYVIPTKARKTISGLKKLVKKADTIILATDEDREGEAIAWHLMQALELGKLKVKTKRIVFHEITKSAIQSALENPRNINQDLVDAQQARRVLDRLVGYKLSPFLWKKISRGLSAGRVQSVAVRLIVEREKEIEAFKPQEYWSIIARLENKENKNFEAALAKINDKTLGKLALKNEGEVKEIVSDLARSEYKVVKIEQKEIKRNPLPPFITSTLQQEAVRKLRFSAKQTMMFAQQLYEGVKVGTQGSTGLITYMRTDSTNLSQESLAQARGFIKKEYGNNYLLDYPRIFKKKSRLAQEAHEAIRPTDSFKTPESIKQYLDANQFKLYNLIWRRFVASQMPQAIFDSLIVDIGANGKKEAYTFQARGQTMKFDGFLRVYPMKFEEINLPPLQNNDILNLLKLIPSQHYTKPPARYNEASLIKILELHGIGRPSTYAPIISTIQYRNYVQKDRSRYFHPTEIGTVVNDMLTKHFPAIVDIEFTSHMEEDLDKIAEGKEKWVSVIGNFYEPFAENLEKKYLEVSKEDMIEETKEVCEKCGEKMIIRMGRFGKFMACSGFPKCKNAKSL